MILHNEEMRKIDSNFCQFVEQTLKTKSKANMMLVLNTCVMFKTPIMEIDVVKHAHIPLFFFSFCFPCRLANVYTATNADIKRTILRVLEPPVSKINRNCLLNNKQNLKI